MKIPQKIKSAKNWTNVSLIFRFFIYNALYVKQLLVQMKVPQNIYHSNEIRPSLMKMSLSARRLFYICLSQIKREYKGDDTILKFDHNQTIKISINEYSELCDIPLSEGHRQAVEGAKDLMKTIFDVPNDIFYADPVNETRPLNRKRNKRRLFNIVTRATYEDGKGYVSIKLSEDISFFISELTNQFTSQVLNSSLALGSSSAAKLYLLLREWICAGKKEYNILTVDALRTALCLENKYLRFNHLKTKFLMPAARLLIKKTELKEFAVTIVERRERSAYKVKIEYRFS